MATITITQNGSHIIFSNSKGSDREILVPKRGLTILRRTSSGTEYIYLNWSAGGDGKTLPSGVWHKDDYKIKYDDVLSPVLASNVALLDLLKEYASTVEDTGAIAVGWYGHDLIDDKLYHGGECKSIQVIVAATFTTLTDNGDNPTTGMVGPALPAGTFISANGKFTEITLAGGTILAIRGDYDDTFATTSTTSTSTTS